MPVYPRDLELGYLKNPLRTYALYFNATSVKEFILTTPWCTWLPVALYWMGAGSRSGFSPEISRCAACCLLSSTGQSTHPWCALEACRCVVFVLLGILHVLQFSFMVSSVW